MNSCVVLIRHMWHPHLALCGDGLPDFCSTPPTFSKRVGVGQARPTGPAWIVVTKIGGRCPPYAAAGNVLPWVIRCAVVLRHAAQRWLSS